MAKYLTKQRKILQNYLENRIDQELSARKVAEDLAEEGISLSAVYRNLAELEQERSVVPCYKEGNREFYFRYIASEDCQSCLHLSCKICNNTQHMSQESTKKLLELVKTSEEFQIELTNSIFYGFCQKCLKEDKETV